VAGDEQETGEKGQGEDPEFPKDIMVTWWPRNVFAAMAWSTGKWSDGPDTPHKDWRATQHT
jgi:hypothetical protein